jgi:hypothetical protein
MQIGPTEFAVEDSPPETLHKLALRRLAALILGAQAAGDDALIAQRLLDRLSTLAQSAGGPAPLPAPPNPELLEQLRLSQGGRRIIGIAENELQIRTWFDEWSTLETKLPERKARWDRLERLLRAAQDLPQQDEIATHVAAIRTNRLLLEDPDPTAAPIDRLVDGLRAAIQDARQQFVDAWQREIAELEAAPEWSRLGDGVWKEILAANELGPVPAVDVGDDAAILAELERRPLSTWADRIAALPSRAGKAREEAVQRLKPKAERVTLPVATIETEQELDEYLATLKATILEKITAGTPVIVSR